VNIFGKPQPAPPTLTEVVEVDKQAAAPVAPIEAAPVAAPRLSDDELRKLILADLQRQVDQMLEVRLREALTPALTRLTDALLRETRGELASTLRDMVAHAVAQELSRHRNR